MAQDMRQEEKGGFRSNSQRHGAGCRGNSEGRKLKEEVTNCGIGKGQCADKGAFNKCGAVVVQPA